MIPVRAGQALSSLAGASGSRVLPDLCSCCTEDDLVPSLHVPASDKAVKQNWCCTFVPIRGRLIHCCAQLRSVPCRTLPGKGWCVWPPCAVRPLGVQGQCIEGKSQSLILSWLQWLSTCKWLPLYFLNLQLPPASDLDIQWLAGHMGPV